MPNYRLEGQLVLCWKYLQGKVRGRDAPRPISDPRISETPNWLKWHSRLSSRRASPEHSLRWHIWLCLLLAYIHILIHGLCLIITLSLHHEKVRLE